MFVLFKNIQGDELNITGQSKVMRLNTAETCTDSNGASEASTFEAIEHFCKRSHNYTITNLYTHLSKLCN